MTEPACDPRGPERTVRIPAGTIAYRERGDGPPVLFVHGVGVNGELWRKVVPWLADGHRCITPDLPWGSHTHPLEPDVDLSLPGMARIVADFLEVLGLREVTVVGNDTGGAVSQALAADRPERLGRLVLTSCDAFDRFPPTPQKYLLVAARSRLLMWLVALVAQSRLFQRTPFAYGWATSGAMPREVMRSYTRPVLVDARVRRDMRRMLRAVDAQHTHAAAAGLRGFDKPALVLWADGDKIFPREHGRQLAELLPQGRFELVPHSRTFIPEEQPSALGERLLRFLEETA